MGFARAWPRRAAVACWLGAVPRAASAFALKSALKDSRTLRRLGFEPSKRLHQPREFRDVRMRGARLGDAYFSLSVLANHEMHARLGLAIAARTVGNAVARNRVKRITRESFRMNQHTLPRVDVTVAARDAARLAAPAVLRSSLERHWQTIAKRW